jgi:hypothetical protein
LQGEEALCLTHHFFLVRLYLFDSDHRVQGSVDKDEEKAIPPVRISLVEGNIVEMAKELCSKQRKPRARRFHLPWMPHSSQTSPNAGHECSDVTRVPVADFGCQQSFITN